VSTNNADTQFLNRITVDYLRDCFSEYDTYIEGKKVGIEKAYEILDRKIYAEISSVYPELKEESTRRTYRTAYV
jgi:hypothetical protein